MEKQENGNDRINNTQRKQLAKLAVDVLDKNVIILSDKSVTKISNGFIEGLWNISRFSHEKLWLNRCRSLPHVIPGK